MFRRVKIAKTDIAIDTKNHLPNEDNGPHGNAAANPPSPHEAGFLRRDVPLALISIGLFSGLINILALTGPLFMVQIYDRVLPSRALPTLIALLVLAVGLYAIFGVLDVVRTRLMARVAGLVDTSLSARVFAAIIRAPLHAKAGGDALRPAHELDLIRSALTGPGPIAIFDLPWIPIYLAICFLLHPLIGWLTAAAMALFVTIAFLTDTKTRSLTRDAATAAAQRNHCAQSAYRGLEAIAAMGMGHALKAHWDAAHEAHVTHQRGASDVGNTLGGTSKAIRYVLQSAALGAGAGNNVWGRRSFKLKRQRVSNNPSHWIRADGAFEPIVDPYVFAAAQTIIARRSMRLSDDQMLDALKRLLDRHGHLSGLIIDETQDVPSSSAYQSRFGSLLRAYSIIGYAPQRDYRYLEINRFLRKLHVSVVEHTISGIENIGGQVTRSAQSDLLHVNGEITVSIVIARCRETSTGTLRWRIRLDASLNPDITIAVRMDQLNQSPLDYYLLPRIDMNPHGLKLAQFNGVSLDIYRYNTLDAFFSLAQRSSLVRIAS